MIILIIFKRTVINLLFSRLINVLNICINDCCLRLLIWIWMFVFVMFDNHLECSWSSCCVCLYKLMYLRIGMKSFLVMYLLSMECFLNASDILCDGSFKLKSLQNEPNSLKNYLLCLLYISSNDLNVALCLHE